MTSSQSNGHQIDLLASNHGFGVGVTPANADVHPNLRDSFTWAGSWSTHFRVSKRQKWILITMSQKNWTKETTPIWIEEFDRRAANAVADGSQ
jgi:hypothetical protein